MPLQKLTGSHWKAVGWLSYCRMGVRQGRCTQRPYARFWPDLPVAGDVVIELKKRDIYAPGLGGDRRQAFDGNLTSYKHAQSE